MVDSSFTYPVTCPPCEEDGRHLSFLYVVMSTNPEARRAIRQTWAKKVEGMKGEFRGRVVFVLSQEEEKLGTSQSENFRDIIVTDIATNQTFSQHKQVTQTDI